jgi:hypothetical protein
MEWAGWGIYSPVVEHLPTVCKALDLKEGGVTGGGGGGEKGRNLI